jgi:alpha-L-fucosidase
MYQPWFDEAKLGIFIHYGIYAVNGTSESWSFFNKETTYEEYMSQLAGFTASKYDPKAWAELFQRAGARYAVLTTKHHDGVALWDTKESELNVVKKTPAGRDLIGPYCDALREQGIRVGLYFSHLDWSHPDYATEVHPAPYTPPLEGRNPFENPLRDEDIDNGRWQNFIRFHRAQLRELCENYQPELFWFDGDWGRSSEQWDMKGLREQLHAWCPQGVVLNARMKGHGDYQTPEQGIPVTRPVGPWEFSMTINDSWGYRPHDQNHKRLDQIVRIFCDVIGMGGNLLLDITPMEDGTIPPPQVEVLEGLGAWIRKHAEAVYPTIEGLPFGHFHGPSTLSRDRKTLYLYVSEIPRREILVKGLQTPVREVRVVGNGARLTSRIIGGAQWVNVPGILSIDVPKDALDETMTVIAVEFDEPLEIYHGPGQSVEKN